MAEGYRAQTNPGGSTALSGASAEAFGAGIGRGIQDAASSVGRIEDRIKARNRDAQNASAGVEFAKISNELDAAEIDGRANAAPGAAGHTETISKVAEERVKTALGNIKDPQLRSAYAARYEDLKGNAANRAHAFEAATHTDYMVSNVGETARTLANGQANNPDALGLQISLETVETVWKNLDAPASTKEKGLRADQRTIVLSYASSMADRDPDAFLGNAGEKRDGILKIVSPYLEPEDIDRLRTRGQAELARLQAQDRQKAAAEEATWREDLSTLGKRVTVMADYSITDGEFDAIEAGAKKYGDKSALVDLANWRDLRNVSIETRDYTPAQWREAVGQLEAIAPAKRTPGQSLRLEHLNQLRGPSEAKFAKDPQAWSTNPPPAIDWDEPTAEQGAARAQWNRAFQRSTGSAPALLNPTEINAFRQRAQSGLAGQLEVAQAMRSLFGVADGKLALQQIDKSNPQLAVMVNLPANTAKDYRIGIDAIGRNAKLNRKDIANEYFSELGPAIPEQLRGPIWDAARAITAAELDRAGDPDPGDDDYRAAFKRGVQRAAGATADRGGFVRWIETPIWIPPEMPKGDALRRLSRAGPVELVAAATDPAGGSIASKPYYMGADGKPVQYDAHAANRLLKEGKLESIAPGVFRIVLEDGGHVVNKNGQFWQFDIRKLK